jgi:hypothetical protein
MIDTVPLVLAGMILLLTTASLAWVGDDAKQRGRNPRQIVILCLITWPLGFLIWRSLRPPPAIDSTAWARLANRPVAFRFH